MTLDPFSPPDESGPAAGAPLVARLAAELAERWRRGERPRAEEFFDRHPELWGRPQAAAELIYEEVCLREAAGEAGVADEVLGRFPQWRDALGVLLQLHQLL